MMVFGGTIHTEDYNASYLLLVCDWSFMQAKTGTVYMYTYAHP